MSCEVVRRELQRVRVKALLRDAMRADNVSGKAFPQSLGPRFANFSGVEPGRARQAFCSLGDATLLNAFALYEP